MDFGRLMAVYKESHYWTFSFSWCPDLPGFANLEGLVPKMSSSVRKNIICKLSEISIVMKRSMWLIWLSFFAFTLEAQKTNSNKAPYPYGNPVIKHRYTADAAPRVMPDGRVWMVTSVDNEDGGGYSTMHTYHSFSSADLVNWVDHGEILNIKDVRGENDPEGEDWALWAPDLIYFRGKYYLFFPIRILYTSNGYEEKSRKTKSYIAVAVSDSPDKKFTVINPKIEGTQGIDPSVFIDDDGEIYLYYGAHFGAKLKENMIEIVDPVKMRLDDDTFMEAIWMNKYNGKYYVSYHTHYDKPVDPHNPDDPSRKKSLLSYCIGDSPLGPFQYGGILNHELGVNVKDSPKLPGEDYVPWRLFQSNHGGIVEYHGQEYLFYHTSALSSWRQDAFQGPGTWTQRSVCIDSLKYGNDGYIKPVQQSLSGVNKVVIKQPYQIVLQRKSIKLKKDINVLEYKNINMGSGYYYSGIHIIADEFPVIAEIRLGTPDGKLAGTVIAQHSGIHETFLRGANKSHDVFVVIKGKAGVKKIRLFAGAPLKM